MWWSVSETCACGRPNPLIWSGGAARPIPVITEGSWPKGHGLHPVRSTTPPSYDSLWYKQLYHCFVIAGARDRNLGPRLICGLIVSLKFGFLKWSRRIVGTYAQMQGGDSLPTCQFTLLLDDEAKKRRVWSAVWLFMHNNVFFLLTMIHNNNTFYLQCTLYCKVLQSRRENT